MWGKISLFSPSLILIRWAASAFFWLVKEEGDDGEIRGGSLIRFCQQFHSPAARWTVPVHWSSCCSHWAVVHDRSHSGHCVSRLSNPAGETFPKNRNRKIHNLIFILINSHLINLIQYTIHESQRGQVKHNFLLQVLFSSILCTLIQWLCVWWPTLSTVAECILCRDRQGTEAAATPPV